MALSSARILVGTPVVLIPKDGSLRLCVDYRELNKHAQQDGYPRVPTVDAMLQSLHEKRVFTRLDLCSGYWQMPLSQEVRSKSAFTMLEEGCLSSRYCRSGVILSAPSSSD